MLPEFLGMTDSDYRAPKKRMPFQHDAKKQLCRPIRFLFLLPLSFLFISVPPAPYAGTGLPLGCFIIFRFL